jgi:glycosyltransferase involved in cell wall biosynthesis
VTDRTFTATLIVPTRNRAELLARLLPSWVEQETQEPYELIIADNGSTDGTAEFVKEAAKRWPQVRIISEQKAGGARARHAGALAARSPLLIFVDDDMRADPKLIAAHLRAHRDSLGGVVLGNIVSAPSRHPFDRMMAYIYDGPKQTLATRQPTARDFWSGNVSLSRELYFRMGGYSDALAELRCGEDMEFGLRLHQAGISMRFAPEALTYHHFTERFGARLNRSYRIGVVCAFLKEQYPEIQTGFARDSRGAWRARAIEAGCRAIAASIEPFSRGEGLPPKLLAFVYDLGLRTAVGRGMFDYATGRAGLTINLKQTGRTSTKTADAAMAG